MRKRREPCLRRDSRIRKSLNQRARRRRGTPFEGRINSIIVDSAALTAVAVFGPLCWCERSRFAAFGVAATASGRSIELGARLARSAQTTRAANVKLRSRLRERVNRVSKLSTMTDDSSRFKEIEDDPVPAPTVPSPVERERERTFPQPTPAPAQTSASASAAKPTSEAEEEAKANEDDDGSSNGEHDDSVWWTPSELRVSRAQAVARARTRLCRPWLTDPTIAGHH